MPEIGTKMGIVGEISIGRSGWGFIIQSGRKRVEGDVKYN